MDPDNPDRIDLPTLFIGLIGLAVLFGIGVALLVTGG